ncbi:Chromosome partition protein smc [Alkalibacterium sp. AK22]|uniref:chromosome segregation protein SMC n=1 Tax=Alkalibacterium sp. AK22 TaxID=1229520 RepID=UPI00044B2CE9|nr:chromosome segregation protein SMC [Alkalibacterium sp. AK22]EXJ22527.1 Chromosome partition protein smc [Alkalibacterium sp. AK22]
MQLKRLEIKGFKSFADKTVLDFTDGITAVVGPNGSGKSNIIEAIRWVMGEQSAKTLRGGRMHDIIFSGTDTRKPINIAEVTLVLENQDGFLPVEFEEVSVTRRINRNGDSDYLINKDACRLKDIVDLFMDSGLGKESFSIISQGQVEAVFNSKAEDRRAIFEEAAGVFKYKTQKSKAERKLFETQDNLDRVQDILFELNGQLEPLREQKDIAQSYVKQKEELTDLDVALSVQTIEAYAKENKALKAQTQKLSEQILTVTTELEQDSSVVKEKKQALHKVETERDAIHARHIDSVKQIERTEARLRLVEEKEKHQDAFLGEKQAGLEKEQAQLDALKDELQEIEVLYNDQNQTVQEQKKAYQQKEEQLNRLMGNKEEAIETLRAQYIEAMQQKTSLNNEETYLSRQLSQTSLSSEKQKKQVQEVTGKLEETKSSLKTKKTELDELKVGLDQLLKQFKQTKAELDALNGAYQQKADRIMQLERQLNRAQAKRQSLAEMQENYAGYFAGVKAVMTAKDQLEGITGTVADMMDVPADYTEAIDVVLGAASQFIIVENEKAGRQAIAYLKQKKAGRATFLPLTTVKPRSLSPVNIDRASSVKGYIGIASELIHYDDKVKAVMGNLLGSTIVAQDLQSANAIAKAVNYSSRVVSLEGDVMNAGGSMTGGGGKRSSNAHLFSQKKEEKALRIEIDELEKTLALRKAESEREDQRRAELSTQLEDLRESGEDRRLAEKQLENEVTQLNEATVRLEREKTGLLFESGEAQTEEKSLTTQLKQVQHDHQQAVSRLEELKAEMDQLSSEKEDSEAQKDRLQTEKSAILEKWNQAREMLASTRSKKDSVSARIAQTEAAVQSLSVELDQLQQGEELESKEDLQDRLNQLKQQSEALDTEEQALKDRHARLDDAVSELDDTISLLQDKRSMLSEEKNQLEIRLSRCDVSIDHLLEYLSEEYSVSYEEARLNQPENLDKEETQKRVKLLKRGIEELGPVNLAAIEEYERVAERHDFLASQQQDLLEAKEKLYDTMDQMDTEVKKRFYETFSQVKEQFALVFPRMFGGGKAQLRLTDPENLLESGVEIEAQPPGKKLQSLSLLSGGERALTALSLLFAIIQVRPIPFCILDEAEAALDEANVRRFGRYLHEFASDTQFIVITHRKGTMEEADSLYGVTMREKGVSNLVSVQLQDIDETVEQA